MKQLLRTFILFVLFLPTVVTAQVVNTTNAERPVPGTCSFCNNPSVFHTVPNSSTPQNGNGTLGNIYANAQCGLNFSQASNRLGKRFTPAGINQPAPFVISGIPSCASILKAYLWAEGSGNGAAQTATVNGPLGSANYPMSIVGQGVDKCWGYGGSYTYRADVTASVSGNGTYNISGILTNPPTAGNDMDGATLLVIWADPTQTYTGNIRIDDGAMICTTFGGSTVYNMNYPAVCGATTNATVFGCMGDLQNTSTTMTWNGTNVPYAWNWWNFLSAPTTVNSGQTTSNFTSLGNGDCFNFCVAGLYYRTTCVTCTPASSVTLTTTSTPATCAACNGTASVTVTPAGAYTYSWSPTGGTGSSASNLCAGTYTVTVTTSCGTATAAVTVGTTGGTITTSGAQTNITCNGSCNGSATVTIVSGTGPFTYSWSPSGGSGSSATGLCAGSYTCTVTGAGGCTGTQSFSITQPPAITNTASQVNITCFGACNGSATVVASGGTGTYTYSWAPAGGTGPSATNLCPGTYTCTISSPAGCTITQTFNITQPPAITLTQSQVNITCNGSCTGSATVVASGGTGTYTYAWTPTGGTGPSATNLCAGTYTCTVSSPAGCTATASFNITQPPPLTATQSQVNLTCNSVCNGSATVVAAGGTGTYTYAWSPSGGSGSTASSLCAGSYTCTISSPAGCSITQTFNITQPPAITATQSQTNVSCNGACDGTASVVASGGTGTYTYSWAPTGGSNATATGLCAGTYTVTISSPAGCSITKTFNITQATAITATTSSTTSTCGNTNGSATVNVSGGVPGYFYSWSPVAGTGPTLSNLAAGAYTCVVTDAAGCTATFVVNVPNAGSPSATITSYTNVTCYGACDGTANVIGGGGTAPYSYSWSPAGGPVPNATNLCPGLYTATVTDANGCIATATVNITQPPQITSTQSQVNITCFSLCNGSASVIASGGTGTYTYAWLPSGGTGSTASGLCAGTYTCTISSPAGCTATASFNITQPTALTVTPSQVNVTCNGSCNGSATVVVGGGTAPYSYVWSPTGGTGSTANGLCAGTYTVTVTDANGCTITQTYTITQPTALTATSSFVQSTCGNPNGSATVTPAGGTPNYNVVWNTVPVQNTPTATNLLAGTYVATITDSNGCTLTVSVTVPNAGNPTATISAFTNVTCNGFCDGTATVVGAGGTSPYTYSWAPSGSGSTATGLCPGTYTATVTDANGCTATATVTITEPPALTISGTQTDVTCNAACNGSATVTVGGGTPSYSYSWAPTGGTGATATALCAGTYSCTVTDANGCTITQTFNITEPTPLTVAAAGFNVTCYGSCDGQIVAIPGGGTPNYQFAWSTGCTSPSCNNICAGVYTITVTDFMGCTATATATVTQPMQITFSTTSQAAHCNQADGCVDVINAAGGTGVINNAWTGGPSTMNWCGVAPGVYTFTLTDANGCDTTSTVAVGNIPGVASTFVSSTNVTCNGACDGTATCSTVAGTGTITYAWTPSGGNALNATNLCNGTYTFTATDSAGCTDTTIVNITQPNPLSVTATANPPAVCAGTSLTVTATGTGGTPVITYNWPSIPGTGASQTYIPTSSGPVTVIATDGNGCIDSTTVNVTVDPIPVASFVGDSLTGCAPLCVNFTDQSTVASGSFNGWTWNFGDGNTSTMQSPQHCYTDPGPYTVTLTVVTSAGCSNTIIMPNYIDVFANPVADFTASPQPTTELDPMIHFTDASSGASNWLWTFGDSLASSTLQNPSYYYDGGAGCYQVTLTVTTNNGCWDTAMQLVCIDPDVTLYVPNAFTPNEDGTNDIFLPQGIGIDPEQFEMWIFDRWGNMIFYTDDFYKGWDGKVQGAENVCQIDTYVWKIKAVDQLGGKHNLIGKVSLIR